MDQSVPQPPRAPRSRGKIVLYCALALCGLLVAAYLTATYLTGPGKSHKTGSVAAASDSPQAAAATVRPSAAPSSAQPRSVSGRVAAWRHGPGMAALRALDARLAVMLQATSSGNITTSARSCSELGTAIVKARAAPPIPDPVAQTWYTKALTEFGQAASECQSGTLSKDPTVVAGAAAAANRGTEDLKKADALIL
jgi:hypothetical protein